MANLTNRRLLPPPVPDYLKPYIYSFTNSPPGFNVPCEAWVRLNRLQTEHGRLTQTCTEWDWLIIKTVCAETSNPPVTSSIIVLFWPLRPPCSITIEYLIEYLHNCSFFRPYLIVLPPVSCVYTTDEKQTCLLYTRQNLVKYLFDMLIWNNLQ